MEGRGGDIWYKLVRVLYSTPVSIRSWRLFVGRCTSILQEGTRQILRVVCGCSTGERMLSRQKLDILSCMPWAI